jgi:hypothetical protein
VEGDRYKASTSLMIDIDSPSRETQGVCMTTYCTIARISKHVLTIMFASDMHLMQLTQLMNRADER